ncbi:uncharacterized protein [Antedon mediterranea]|uniref:uncharacterized protein n=1 Tax=Antedon mediterranea TaxID=105859 RepID=UPI003AF58DFB
MSMMPCTISDSVKAEVNDCMLRASYAYMILGVSSNKSEVLIRRKVDNQAGRRQQNYEDLLKYLEETVDACYIIYDVLRTDRPSIYVLVKWVPENVPVDVKIATEAAYGDVRRLAPILNARAGSASTKDNLKSEIDKLASQ